MGFHKYVLLIIILIFIAGISTYVALESDVFVQEEKLQNNVNEIANVVGANIIEE